jgi:DNA-3-methyladenine glycosylase
VLTSSQVYRQDFFERQTPVVARELLGAKLCRRLADGRIEKRAIVETEAYRDNEPACHAARGPTPRCQVLFGEAGIAYVYFIYGMYNCLNVVTEKPGVGCAVLIRALEGVDTSGPGKLCRTLAIDRSFNGLSLMDQSLDLWIEPGAGKLKPSQIGVSERIGISKAQELPWRFFIKDHPHVSGPKRLRS